MPTHAGLRLFVDGLLEVGDLAEEDRRDIEARLTRPRPHDFEEALNEASAILSGLAGGAGVVVTPGRATPASSTSSSWRSAPTRRWRSWCSTTARWRTG